VHYSVWREAESISPAWEVLSPQELSAIEEATEANVNQAADEKDPAERCFGDRYDAGNSERHVNYRD
jgi:hypothetical protein